jgi:hypothetical protein
MPTYNPALADAGWSSLVARRAHNPKVVGSNPAPATKDRRPSSGASDEGPLVRGLFVAAGCNAPGHPSGGSPRKAGSPMAVGAG